MSLNRWWGVTLVSLGLAAACAGVDPVPDGADGLWRARRPGGGDQVRLELYRGPVGHRETERVRLFFDLGEIEGLDASTFRGGPAPVEFRVQRPAGTLLFEGQRARRPAGSFRLEPAAEFVEQLSQLDLNHDDREQLLDLAIYGVSLDLVESLLEVGYAGGDAGDLLRLHDYGLTPEWIASMARLAGPPTVHELLTLRRHGIDSREVDRWVAAGVDDLAVGELVRLHSHGVDASAVALYRGQGFDDVEAWLRFHRNGVPEKLILAVLDSGAPEADVETIVELHVKGVGADGVRAAAALIASGYDWDALIYLRRRGVSPEYAGTLIDSGWEGLDAEKIATLAVNGLDTEWILRVREASHNELDADDLVQLHRHGVGASRFEAYAKRGYVSRDEVVLLSNAGVDESVLQRLAEAGLVHPDADEVVQAARRGIADWIERNGR